MEGASKYYSVVTDTGNKLMAAALAAGEKLTITEIAVGDGDGAYYQPDPEMTALKMNCGVGVSIHARSAVHRPIF